MLEPAVTLTTRRLCAAPLQDLSVTPPELLCPTSCLPGGLREAYSSQLRLQLPRVAPKHMLAWEALHINSFRWADASVHTCGCVGAYMGIWCELV